MAQIPLVHSTHVTVDDDDFEWLSKYTWYHTHRTGRLHHAGYASTPVRTANGKTLVLMHRMILGLPPRLPRVDHHDGDGLNNQRTNLRVATQSQNNFNRGPARMNTSGHKGVSLYKRTGKWQAQLRAHGKKFHFGFFDTIEEAIAVYAEEEAKHHGEFSYLARTKGTSDAD